MSNKKKCLIIETHSDDSCISAYGFLNKFRSKYDYYFALMVASNVKLNAVGRIVTKYERLEEYGNYVSHFNGHIVTSEIRPFDADTKLDQIPRGDVVYSIEQALNIVRPDLMLVTGKSPHMDHTVTYEAAISALRPCGTWKPNQVLIMENSTHTRIDPSQTELIPNFYCSLTESEIETKMNAFYDLFPSQRRPNTTALSNEGIKNFARYRGLEIGVDYAEAFYQLYNIV